jgi:hypothetical protein
VAQAIRLPRDDPAQAPQIVGLIHARSGTYCFFERLIEALLWAETLV